MKKLFTLAAAILASFSMWAENPTLPADAIPSTAYDATVKEANLYAITDEVSGGKQYFVYDFDTIRTQMKANKVTWIKGPKNDGGNSAGTISFADGLSDADKFGFNTTWNRAWGINNGRYAGIRVTKCVEFAALTKSNSTKDGKTLYMHVFVKNADSWDFVETIGKDDYNNSKYYVLKATLDNTKEYVILLTSGNSSNCLTAQIRFASTYCEDPELTVSPTEGTGFVGDAIDINITSKNQSKPINAAVTVDGVAGVYGTDYTFKASTGLVQATPLRAGTFVITFSQASNGTYCDAEESATFVISAKNPVTSFEIDAPATAHVGEEVTIELKNFNAAPTTIVWYDGEMNEITAANGKTSYTFTPAAAGNYIFQATAWNAYNTYNVDEAYNYTIITVNVGTDASLSDLKVNGTTLGDFATNKYEYAIGEFGVYEAINVTATAADAPYATVEVVDDKAGTITVTVTAEDKTTTQNYVMTYTRKAATELVAISESTTWDWSKAGSVVPEFKDDTKPTKTEEFNFADVLISPDAEFNAAALVGIAQFANRSGSYFQGNMVKFNTTVKGTVEIFYQNTSNRDESGRRWVVVNSTKVGDGAIDQKAWYSASTNVAAGEVKITFVDANEAETMLRINKIVFTKDEATALDNTEASVKAVKFFQNGQLFIEKNGKVYTIIGSEIR